jgi:O-antigen/teichoic acid export membrane protein
MFLSLNDRFHALLRWSEKYTKTDMHYMVRGGFWLTLAKGVGMFSSLLLATAMANLISPEVFGTYKFVLSAAGIIGAFSLTATGTSIVQAVARGYEGAYRSGISSYLKWSVGASGLAVAAAIYYFANGNTTLGLSFLLVAICNPILIGYSFFSQFISGKRDFRTQSVFDSIADFIPAVILIASLFFTHDPILIVLTYFASGIVVNLALHYATLHKYRPNDSVDPQSIPYARHLSLMGILGKMGENVDKVLVFHYLGAAQLAIYAFAQTPIAQLKMLNEIPSRLSLPKFSERQFHELQRSLPRKILLLVGIMLAIVVAYILLAPLFFKILFPKYLGSIIYTQVLALSLVLTPASVFSDALIAHMRKKELYVSQVVLPVTKIALFAILLPVFGLWGAIWATIASQCVTFTVYAYLFWRVKHEA